MTRFLSKICCDCGVDKDISEYYRSSAGYFLRPCKDCHKARMKVRRLTNPYVQKYDRDRSKTPERIKHSVKITAQWRQNNPDAYRAQNAVSNAIRAKRLERGPCSLCGTVMNVHGHHKDYTKPLDVVWLCAKCHQRIHATFPELGGNFEATP